MKRATAFAILVILGLGCTEEDAPTSPEGNLRQGTWGGDNVSIVVTDDTAHVHVGCTIGDFPAPIAVDAEGRFNVSGSYMLRAYPIPIGPTVPAQLAGVVSARSLTFTVAVNDTVTGLLVVLGPSTVNLGQEPQMAACPICVRGNGQRATGMKASRRAASD